MQLPLVRKLLVFCHILLLIAVATCSNAGELGKKNIESYVFPYNRINQEREFIRVQWSLNVCEREDYICGSAPVDARYIDSVRYLVGRNQHHSLYKRKDGVGGFNYIWSCPYGPPAVFCNNRGNNDNQAIIQAYGKKNPSIKVGFKELPYASTIHQDEKTNIKLKIHDSSQNVSVNPSMGGYEVITPNKPVQGVLETPVINGYRSIGDVLSQLPSKNGVEFLILLGGEGDHYRVLININFNTQTGYIWLPDAGAIVFEYPQADKIHPIDRNEFIQWVLESGVPGMVELLLPQHMDYEVQIASITGTKTRKDQSSKYLTKGKKLSQVTPLVELKQQTNLEEGELENILKDLDLSQNFTTLIKPPLQSEMLAAYKGNASSYALVASMMYSLHTLRVRRDQYLPSTERLAYSNDVYASMDKGDMAELRSLAASAVRHTTGLLISSRSEALCPDKTGKLETLFPVVQQFRQWQLSRSLIVRIASASKMAFVHIKDLPSLQVLIFMPGQVVYAHNDTEITVDSDDDDGFDGGFDKGSADCGNAIFFGNLLRFLNAYFKDEADDVHLSLAVSDNYGEETWLPDENLPKVQKGLFETIKEKTGLIATVMPRNPKSHTVYQSHVDDLINTTASLVEEKYRLITTLNEDLDDMRAKTQFASNEHKVEHKKNMKSLAVLKGRMDEARRLLENINSQLYSYSGSDGHDRQETLKDESMAEALPMFYLMPSDPRFKEDIWTMAMGFFPDFSVVVEEELDTEQKPDDCNVGTDSFVSATPMSFERSFPETGYWKDADEARKRTVEGDSAMLNIVKRLQYVYWEDASDDAGLLKLAEVVEVIIGHLQSQRYEKETKELIQQAYHAVDTFLLQEAKKQRFTGPLFSRIEVMRIQSEQAFSMRYPYMIVGESKKKKTTVVSYNFPRLMSQWADFVRIHNPARYRAMFLYYSSLANQSGSEGLLQERGGLGAGESGENAGVGFVFSKRMQLGFIEKIMLQGRIVADPVLSTVPWSAIAGGKTMKYEVADRPVSPETVLDEIEEALQYRVQLLFYGRESQPEADHSEGCMQEEPPNNTGSFWQYTEQKVKEVLNGYAYYAFYPQIEFSWLVRWFKVVLNVPYDIESAVAGSDKIYELALETAHILFSGIMEFLPGLEGENGRRLQHLFILLLTSFAEQSRMDVSDSFTTALIEQGLLYSLRNKEPVVTKFEDYIKDRSWSDIKKSIHQSTGYDLPADRKDILSSFISLLQTVVDRHGTKKMLEEKVDFGGSKADSEQEFENSTEESEDKFEGSTDKSEEKSETNSSEGGRDFDDGESGLRRRVLTATKVDESIIDEEPYDSEASEDEDGHGQKTEGYCPCECNCVLM